MSLENRYTEYDTWAWLYNQTMGPQYCKNQLQPLQKMLLPNLPQGAHILDLCCGTGHIMQPLLEQGYQVTGLDGSETMLGYAQQNAPGAQLILGDARSFELPSTVDAVFSTSASLNHIMSLEELKAVFHNVYAVLNEQGIFLFDLNHSAQMKKWWNGQMVEGEIEENFAWAITPSYNPEDRTGNFKVTVFRKLDAAAHQSKQLMNARFGLKLKQSLYNILEFRILTRFRLKLLSQFQFWERDWQRSDMVYQVKGYTQEEVRSTLEAVGFTNIEIHTLDGNPMVDDNHSAYFVCCKLATASARANLNSATNVRLR